ncbi:hypothetical protein ES707_15429 [subsurface metagenome]
MRHTGLQYLFSVNQKLYLNIEDKGFGTINETNEFHLLENGSFFQDKLVKTCFEIDNILYVGTEGAGIYSMQNYPASWNSDIGDLVEQAQLYSAIKLNKNYLSFGTITSGLIITDKNGTVVQQLNIDKGIQNNSILSIFSDKEGNLWLGLDNGIDYVYITSPLSSINPKAILGACYYSLEENGILYLGTNQGLYLTDWNRFKSNTLEPNNLAFQKILTGQVWKIQKLRNNLVVGHNEGTFLIEGNSVSKIADIDGGWQYHLWPGDSTRMIASTFHGLVLFGLQNGRWKFIKQYDGFEESCPEFEIDQDGLIWLCHRHKGVFQLRMSPDLRSIEAVEFFDTTRGLPSNYMNVLFRFEDEIYISNNHSVYAYNTQQNLFQRHEEMTNLFKNRNVSKVYPDKSRNYWYFHERGISVLRSNFDGTYLNHDLPYFDAERLFIKNYQHLLPLSYTDIIISSRNGYIHFNPTLSANVSKQFSVFIRTVESSGGIEYYGDNKCIATPDFSDKEPHEIPFKNNSIIVRVGTDYFRNLQAVQYQYWLEGWHAGWSSWTTESTKSYSNLHEGSYILHVRGRNEFKRYTEESIFIFDITPPWYRGSWAIFSYTILSVLFLILIIYLVVKKIEKEKEILHQKQKEEMDRKHKQYEQDTIITEQEIVKLRNEKLKIENERNQAELENKSTELAAIIMQANYKNDLFNRIKHKLTKVCHKMLHMESKKEVENVISSIEKELDQKEDWNRFEVHFDQVHEDFIHRLRKQYPELSPKDLKLAAYLRMNLVTKEIAPLLNLSMRGIETGRYRLRKKLGLGRSDNLTDILLSI